MTEKYFRAEHVYFKRGSTLVFTDLTAPDWLTYANVRPGSTLDDSWFWRDHVLTLKIGESVDTDFWKITRIEDPFKAP